MELEECCDGGRDCGQTLRVVVAVFGAEGDVSAVLMELDAPAVELYHLQPCVARWRPGTQGGRAGNDAFERSAHGWDVGPFLCKGRYGGSVPAQRGHCQD
jgi:hypothetical protein